MTQFNTIFGQLATYLNECEPKPTYAAADEVIESDTDYTIHLEVPGMDKSSLSIDIDSNKLIITGDKKESAGKILSSTRTFKKFKNVYTLSPKIDTAGISAILKDGVLTITLPKSKDAHPKHIDIQLG